MIYIQEENKHQWDRPIEFVLSLISNSVGLGNVWRFPYLAAQSGGGQFSMFFLTVVFFISSTIFRCFSYSILYLVLSHRCSIIFYGTSPGTIYQSRTGYGIRSRQRMARYTHMRILMNTSMLVITILFRCWYCDDYSQCAGTSVLQCFDCLGSILLFPFISFTATLV